MEGPGAGPLDNYTCVHLHSHLLALDMEKEFRTEDALRWSREKRMLPVYCVILYLLFITFGQSFMKNRNKFQLKGPLIVWNAALALFSILGTIRGIPEMTHSLTHHGLHHSICSFPVDRISTMWGIFFTFSKIPELGDTVFIVLRKQPLIFLHWYHHVTVLLYTWFAITELQAPGRWFTCINFLIHSLMYTYFMLKSMGYRPYKFIQMAITLLQLLQMVIGCYINYYVYRLLLGGQGQDAPPCQVSLFYTNLSSLMYFSYLLLFANFFYRTYLSRPVTSKDKVK